MTATNMATATADAVDQPELVGQRPGGRIREAFRSRRLTVGVGIVGLFVLVAIIGPYFFPNANQIGGPQYAGPSARYWLGTTQTGQDVFAQLVVSTRASMEICAGVALAATIISVVIGIGGAYAGGLVDEAFSLVSNFFLVIPTLPLIIVILAYVKNSGIIALILIIGLTSWAASARVLRAQTLSVRNREYVLAARASGEKTWRIILAEIMPNELPIIVSQFIFGGIFAILTQTALQFIGLGNPTLLTWGNMLNLAYSDEALDAGAWWWIITPGLCIALLGTGLALINFSLDEVLNPRLRVYRPGRAQQRRQRLPAHDAEVAQ